MFVFSAQLYASTILASSLTYSASPIFFEFCVEIVYPVPEGIVGGFLTCIYNICGMIFLFLFYIPDICKYFKYFCRQTPNVIIDDLKFLLKNNNKQLIYRLDGALTLVMNFSKEVSGH